MTRKAALALVGAVLAAGPIGHAQARPEIRYLVRVDSAALSGWEVELQLRNAPDSFRLAMAAHPEYDDRYWRYLTELQGSSPHGPVRIARRDSALWSVELPRGEGVIRYRIRLPPPEGPPRAAWRPFLAAAGGLLGGPHTFLYLLGAEAAPAHITLELPQGWQIATALSGTQGPGSFLAANAAELMEAPILVGRFSSWSFSSQGVPHRVVYWRLPAALPFDTTAFVSSIERFTHQALRLFGGAPYHSYTFLFQDGAYGGLEHPNSVTLGASSAELAKNPYAFLAETAHEFVHTWNLMQLRPVEYRGVDYRTQPPVAGLWFSEGLTLFYADLLLRRAGLPVADSTRAAHLERLLSRYLASPGNWYHSAEAVSRVAYNAPPGSLGDYSAGTHLQGEVLGAMLDLAIRAGTEGARSMDDVMRVMLERYGGVEQRGFAGRDVEQTVEEVCRCEVTPLFDAHIRAGGRPIDFDRYLAPVGLRTRVSWAPAIWNGQPERDLRIFGWTPPGGSGVRLVVSDPGSIWGRAGLHTGDELVSFAAAPVMSWPDLRARLLRLQIGDTVRVTVRRATGEYTATVTLAGFERPTVRLEEIPGASERQRALRAQWLR